MFPYLPFISTKIRTICYHFAPPHFRIAENLPISLFLLKTDTSMIDTTMALTVLIGVMIAGLLGYLFYLQRKSKIEETQKIQGGQHLQLQAYERLTLLVDRIALPNLITRVNQPGISAKEMQLLLTRTLKEEFDYNITQQIYVSAEAWKAIKNLKEQNTLVINQFANALPANASGLDLNKVLLEYLMTDTKGALHEVVSEVLSYEAKKLL